MSSPESRIPVAVGERGLQIRSLDDLFRFAQYVARSGLAPKGMQEPEKVLVAIQTGMEAGMTPLRALSSVVVINGAPSWKGDAARALVENSGELKIGTSVQSGVRGEADQMIGWCRTWRREEPEAHETTFSVLDAKRAGLWGKQGPWTQYPKRMLMYRAMGFHLRDHFSHVLLGLRIAEEQQDIELQQIAVTAGNGTPPSTPLWALDAPAHGMVEPLPALHTADDPTIEDDTADPEVEAPAVSPDAGDRVSLSEPLPEDGAEHLDVSTISPEQQSEIWAIVRGRWRVKSEATQALARILAKHGCRRTEQVRLDQFSAVCEMARTLDMVAS